VGKLPLTSWYAEASKPYCKTCGWRGNKDEMASKKVGLEAMDTSNSSLKVVLASPPIHRVEYRCPKCSDLIASDLKYHVSFYDEESFPD
jgi:predicted RNA-binding Zn-ribbon protein involved in translation (DUF1610 family)